MMSESNIHTRKGVEFL